jgi:hypothetical protein
MIKKYFNDLPSNTEIIDVSYKWIKKLPNLSRFTNLKTLICNPP